jgi:hypothetical protein
MTAMRKDGDLNTNFISNAYLLRSVSGVIKSRKIGSEKLGLITGEIKNSYSLQHFCRKHEGKYYVDNLHIGGRIILKLSEMNMV